MDIGKIIRVLENVPAARPLTPPARPPVRQPATPARHVKKDRKKVAR